MEYPSLKIRGVTVAQFPNSPLGLAIAALLAARLTEGATADISRAAGYVSFGVWAYEEATDGVDRFRQGLGLAGLGLATAALARDLSSR